MIGNVIKKKTRNSSVELLRIVAMIDITLFHYLSRNYNLYAVENSRILEDPCLWKEMISQYIGYLGVPCFMFISGYYGLSFKWNKFGNIVEQTIVYGIASFIGLWVLLGEKPVNYQLLVINNYWFIVAYLMVLLVSPGLNAMVEKLSSRQLLLSIIALYAVDFGGVVASSSVGGGFATLLMIYLTARWMKLYLPEKVKKTSCLWALGILLVQLSLVSACYLFHHIGIKVIVGSYDNPLNILLAGFIVISVEHYHFYSRWLNKMAASTLSVYLLSESGFGQIFFNKLYVGGQDFSVLHYLLASIAVFFIIDIIDMIRIKIRGLFLKSVCTK